MEARRSSLLAEGLPREEVDRLQPPPPPVSVSDDFLDDIFLLPLGS